MIKIILECTDSEMDPEYLDLTDEQYRFLNFLWRHGYIDNNVSWKDVTDEPIFKPV